MNISVIIATHQRAESLRQTLESFCGCEVPPGIRWELIVVNNGSTDDTENVCRSFQERLPLTCLFEGQPGKSHALNAALRHASAPLLLLTDDDVNVPADWLVTYLKAAEERPDAWLFGGKVLAGGQVNVPAWYTENTAWLSVNPRVDHGEREIVLTQFGEYPLIGANLAIRKSFFDSGTTFDADIGPKGEWLSQSARHGGEDTDIQRRLFSSGRKALYVPKSVVFHRDPPERFTRKYVRWYYRQHSMEEVRRGVAGDSPARILGAPRFLWRELFTAMFLYAATRWVTSSKVWLRHDVKVATVLGRIQQFRELSRTNGTSAAV